jgi:hypothetical protein
MFAGAAVMVGRVAGAYKEIVGTNQPINQRNQ